MKRENYPILNRYSVHMGMACMHLKTHQVIITLLLFFIPLTAYTIEENPATCDCSTTEVSDHEVAQGCPSEVKKEFCVLYHQVKIWKERLRLQQENRRLDQIIVVPASSR